MTNQSSVLKGFRVERCEKELGLQKKEKVRRTVRVSTGRLLQLEGSRKPQRQGGEWLAIGRRVGKHWMIEPGTSRTWHRTRAAEVVRAEDKIKTAWCTVPTAVRLLAVLLQDSMVGTRVRCRVGRGKAETQNKKASIRVVDPGTQPPSRTSSENEEAQGHRNNTASESENLLTC